MKVVNYMYDGADHQARIVLELVKNRIIDKTMTSAEWEEIRLSRFHNCREQGYFVYLNHHLGPISKTLTIAFSENRNSDDIVVYVTKESRNYEPTNEILWPTNQSVNNEDAKSTYFRYGKWLEAAEYIIGKFEEVIDGK